MLDRVVDVPGSGLDSEAYLEDFWSNFDKIVDRFWKLERCQSFQEPGNPSWEAMTRGEWGLALLLGVVVSLVIQARESKASQEQALRVLHAMASNLFAGEIGRKYWADVRTVRLQTPTTKRSRHFHALVDAEYHTALTSARQEREAADVSPIPCGHDAPDRVRSTAARVLAPIVVGVGVVMAWRRFRRIVERSRGR